MSPKKIIFLVSAVAIFTAFFRAQATNTINANTFTATTSVNFISPITGSVDGKNYTGKAAAASYADAATSCTYLSATPTKCSAGNYPLGIDVYGNAVNCTALPSGGTDSQQLGVSGNTITLTNSSAITAPYATNAGYAASAASATNCTNANYLSYSDNRAIAPKNFGHNLMAFGFGSYTNNSASPWADFIELNSYQDASGGNDNLLVINRNAFGARLYQQTYNSATAFSTYKDIVLAENSPTANYLPKYSGTGNSVSVANSLIFDNGTNVGIGTTSPVTALHVNKATGDSIITASSAGSASAYSRYVRAGANGWAIGRDNNGASFRISYGSSDTPDFSVAASNYFNILNNGNVGIGTTNPTGKLDVSTGNNARLVITSPSANRLQLQSLDGATSDQFFDFRGYDFSFKTNGGTLAMYMKPDGNVGIGTTNPLRKLEVNNALRLTNSSSDQNDGVVGSGTFAAGLNLVGINTDSTYRKINIWGGITQNQNDGGNTWTGNSYFPGSGIWNASGNVGIGIASPNGTLNVSNGGVEGIEFYPGYSGDLSIIQSYNRTADIYDELRFNASNFSFYLSGGSSSGVYISSAGKVGIGSGLTSPTQLLQVAGNIYLSSGTSNTLYFGTPGVAAPGAGSLGEKIQLYGAAGTNSSHDYALGIENSNLWFNTDGGFKFYTAGSLLTTLNSSGLSVLGNISAGGNKVTAGTFDPLYTINNKRYATYLSGMTGVKEETAGVISLDCSGKACSKTIDFNNQPEGSDLWLFSKVTNLKNNFAAMSVILTPSVSQPVWYEKDPINQKLTLKTGNTAHRTGTIEVSYRLTAPRFDSASWKNTSTETEEGFNLDKLIK